MSYESTIHAFQTVLENFKFSPSSSFNENFAIKRFEKKFERPNQDASSALSNECWNNWLDYDNSLREIRLPTGAWYKVRALLHSELVPVRFDTVHLPKGSEFVPTSGQNSVEARLCQSRWTCTSDNFSRMAAVCYGHKALKRAVRNRYASWFAQKDFDITTSQADAYLYKRFSGCGDRVGLRIFTWKLRRVCVITHGSRFSTVPKNNDQRRPINVEPFGNVITQRAVGEHLRNEIHRIFSVDLDTLAGLHRQRIQYVNDIATIDLKNASDSVSRSLCKFLLPRSIFNALEETRSHFVLGPDGNYHHTKKISSMGNGFTFELMTLILLALCRVYDETATVFGDDIIIKRDYATQLIADLEAVGFVVNTDKSFTDGPFRESCGANFHLQEGYIESYDFLWPSSIGDCVVLWNKCVRLSAIYPSFLALRHALYRVLPHALRGGPSLEFILSDMDMFVSNGWTGDSTSNFPLFFVTPNLLGNNTKLSAKLVSALSNLQLDPSDFRLVSGFQFESELRSKTLKHLTPSHWAKYEMYLYANRRTKDVLRGRGKWKRIWFVNSGERHFRASALIA